MKTIKLINKYMQGIRFPAVFLSIMMTISIFMAVFVCSFINFRTVEYNMLKQNTIGDRSYYVQLSDRPMGGLTILEAQKRFRETKDELKENKAVENIYTIKSTSLTYIQTDSNGYATRKNVGIILYTDELLEAFPMLLNGESFGDDPYSCIIGTKFFNDLKDGDVLTLHNSYKELEFTFKVAGHLNNPYTHMSFNGGGSTIRADDMFQKGDFIILRDSEALPEDGLTSSLHENYVLTFREDADQEEIDQIANELSKTCGIASFDSILSASKTMLLKNIKAAIPVPLFALVISTIAYFSLMILIFKKKEGDIAVMYLCGGSKKKSCLITFHVFNMISFIPAAINIVILLVANRLDWKGIINLQGANLAPNNSMILMVVGYYLISAIIAIAVIATSMSKQTPLTYLKGTEK